MEIPQVTTLPELNQDAFPAFPEIPDGKTLLAFATEWQNSEKEWAAGCLVNFCLRKKKWQPVHAEQFIAQMKTHPMIAPFVIQGVANALWCLVGDGFITAVNFQGANHFIPTPRLAQVFLANARNFRVA